MGKKYSHAFDGLKKEVERLRIAINDAAEISLPEYLEEQREVLKEIGFSAVKQFYENYEPEYYTDKFESGKYGKRKYDLYKVIEIGERNKRSNYFNLNPNNLDEHPGSGNKKDIIYSLSFKEGKHGGSIYRKPLGIWKYPSRNAEEDDMSIIENIQKQVNNQDFQGMLNRIYRKNLDKLL